MNPYEIVIEPLITEKGMRQVEHHNSYTFRVHKNANKHKISEAVEKIYKVKVSKVNVLNVCGKKRRVRYKAGMTSDWKKAVVRLEEGYSINLI